MKEVRIKILLLEDDPNLGFVLKEHLEMQGFAVALCVNGVEGQNEIKKKKYDLCLVDVMMPEKDGFTFARELRVKNQAIPIMFLTARSLKEDRIEGFRIGADDYVTKPFSMEELLLRINAVLKRTSILKVRDSFPKEISIGKYIFNYPQLTLSLGSKKKITLTTKEAELLKVLCQHKDSTVSREVLLEQVWGNDTYFTSRSMAVYVSKLRKHLSRDASISIITVHGVGLKLTVM